MIDDIQFHGDAFALALLRRWQQNGDRRSATISVYDAGAVVTLYEAGDRAGEGHSTITGTTAEAALDALRRANTRTPNRSAP